MGKLRADCFPVEGRVGVVCSWYDDEDWPPLERRSIEVIEADAPSPLLFDAHGRRLARVRRPIGFGRW